MSRKKEKEKMLLFTEEDKKGVVSVCDSIMSGKELNVKQLEATYFMGWTTLIFFVKHSISDTSITITSLFHSNFHLDY